MNTLINKFVMEKCKGDGSVQRLLCGRLSGTVGICLKLVMGALKLLVGFMSGSVAVMADAINNLTDAATSIVTLVGFSLAAQKSDDEHPFGHARMEYMTGIIVSIIIIIVGGVLIFQSYPKIIHPETLSVSAVTIILLVVLLFADLWLFLFNRKLSRLIGSASLKAASIDSRNDMIVTTGIIVSLLLWRFTGIQIDGYVGVAVGAFVIYAGIGMVRETAAPLLGQSPDPLIVENLINLIRSKPNVLAFHDLIVHDYGPGNTFASVHIEVDASQNIFELHEMIDGIEQEAMERYGILLVGHMDPIDTNNPKLNELREMLTVALAGSPGFRGFHDLRVVPGAGRTNVIFDIVVSHDAPEKSFEEARRRAQQALDAAAKEGERFSVVATCDSDYAPGWAPKA